MSQGAIRRRPGQGFRDFFWGARWHLRRLPERALRLGVPASLMGSRWRDRVPLRDYVATSPDEDASLTVVREAKTLSNPLPKNVGSEDRLDERGSLWGYSMRDVPQKRVGPTFIARLANARLLFFETPDKRDFFPALIAPDGRSIEAREISHRPAHAASSRQTPVRLGSGTWFCERAYHNHSHWLTAHLPKLLLLQSRGETDEILLPKRRTAVMDASMRMMGIDPAGCIAVDTARPLDVARLRLVETDRFDPVHLTAVRDAFAAPDGPAASRRIMISRARSRGRRIVNETALWDMLRELGFEKVRMEELDFVQQVAMMQQTRVLLAPHGAGLTNMIFCPPGADIVELADPEFPNPNFYAMACALGHDYWLDHTGTTRAAHALDRDLVVDVDGISRLLDRMG